MKTHAAIFLAASLPCLALDGTIKSKIVDPENHTVTEIVADSRGRVLKKTLFLFEIVAGKERQKGAVHYDTKDNIRYKERYRLDDKNRIAESWLYSKNDVVLGRRIYRYNVNGTVAGIDDYDAKGAPVAAKHAAGVPPRNVQPNIKQR